MVRNTHLVVLIWILITTLTLAAGCGRTPAPRAQPPTPPPSVEAPESVPPPPAAGVPEPFLHQVRSGDTLATIAQWYTGTQNNWTALARANPTIDPRRMDVGTFVQIPTPLLTRREPMPPRPRAAPSRVAPSKEAPKPREPAAPTATPAAQTAAPAAHKETPAAQTAVPAAHTETPTAEQETVSAPEPETLDLFGPIEAPRQPAPLELEALP